jgi:hypothetical protein
MMSKLQDNVKGGCWEAAALRLPLGGGHLKAAVYRGDDYGGRLEGDDYGAPVWGRRTEGGWPFLTVGYNMH